MKVVNWNSLRLLKPEIEEIKLACTNRIPVEELCRIMVRSILKQSPWEGRTDLVPLYHPSESYTTGEWIALSQDGSQGDQLKIWQLAKIIRIIDAQNPHQGSFQVLEFEDRQIESVACAIQTTTYLNPDSIDLSKEEIDAVSLLITRKYADHLKKVLAGLITDGTLNGNIIGLDFVPIRLDDIASSIVNEVVSNLSTEKPFISIDEIINAIQNDTRARTNADQELILMVESILSGLGHKNLGNGYWTTVKLFNKMMREIPRGVPAPHIHSTIGIWTEEDRKLLQVEPPAIIPGEIRISEIEVEEIVPQVGRQVIQGDGDSHKLPALTYLHITQAYFPVAKFLNIFPEEATLFDVRLVSGDYQKFLLNRETGHLVALDRKLFYETIHDEYPAGTYFWIKSEGVGRFGIFPKILRKPRVISCKLVKVENGKLIIEKTEMLMKYQGDPRIFKADLRFNDIEAFYREAKRNNLSVCDAIIRSIQELSDNDPDDCAHISDIFNLVFLKRMCSPRSVSLLLYTQPFFKQLGNGFFRYEPIRQAQQRKYYESSNQSDGVREDIVVELNEDHLGRLSGSLEPEPVVKIVTPVIFEKPGLEKNQIDPTLKVEEQIGEGNRLTNPIIEKSYEDNEPSPVLPEPDGLIHESPMTSTDTKAKIDIVGVNEPEKLESPLPTNLKIKPRSFFLTKIWKALVNWWGKIKHKSQEVDND